MTWASDLEGLLGAPVPGTYLALGALGCFDVSNPAYLWLFEAEWIPPREIPVVVDKQRMVDGIVPFAFTGAGDYWCWRPVPGLSDIPVVFCPHDLAEADSSDPSFDAWLFHQTLAYATGGFDPGAEGEARQRLDGWSRTLEPFLPAAWIAELRQLSDAPLRRGAEFGFGASDGGFLTPADEAQILGRLVGNEEGAVPFVWRRIGNKS